MTNYSACYLLGALALASGVFICPPTVRAQEKAQPRARAVRVEAAQVLRPAIAFRPAQAGNAIEQQKADYAQEMAVHIDELHRVCSLSGPQRKKLELAAKGAVAATVEEWKVCARQVQARLGGRLMAMPAAPVRALAADDAADEAPGKVEEPEEEEEPELRIDARLLSILNASGYLPEPHRQSRWVRALGKVLSDEQAAKVEAAESARRKHRRTFGVATHVDQLDYTLRFSPEQRQRVTQIVDSIMGPFLEGEIAPGRNNYVYGDVPMIRPDDLQPVLTPAQAAAWKRHNDGRANVNGRMIGPGIRRAMPINMRAAQPGVTLGMAYVAGPLSADVRIDYLVPGGPAAKAGLQLRDELKSIDGTPIQSWVIVNSRLNGKSPGDKVTLVVTRGGEEKSFEVSVARRGAK